MPSAAVLRTCTLSETDGFLKVLVAADGDRIIGFTAVGMGAGELIAVVQCDAGKPALHRPARRYPDASDHGRGARCLFANEPRLSTPGS
jgi:hypothetical protein